MPDIWSLASIGAKVFLYTGILTSVGLVLCRLIFSAHLSEHDRSIKPIILGFATLAFVAALISFALRGAVLMGDISGMADFSILSILWDTPPGDAVFLRVLGLMVLILGVALGGLGYWAAICGGAIALWSFCEIGHIANSERIIVQIVLFLHLLAASFWVGIFIPLRRLALDRTRLSKAAGLGESFGKLASIVIPILLAAGLIMTWLLVGSIYGIFASAYGKALLIKLILVAGLLGLGAMNKLRFVPALMNEEPEAGECIARAISFEWLFFVLILLATATFTSVMTVPS